MPAFGYRSMDFTIAGGGTLSAAVQLNGLHGEAIVMPAAWTAAGLSFTAGDTELGTFQPLFDGLGVELTMSVLASQTIVLPISMIRAFNWLKMRSGTSAVPVVQGTQRVVSLLARSYS